jgi:hypothetical protein
MNRNFSAGTIWRVRLARAGGDQSLYCVRTIGAVKAAGFEGEPAARTEQRPRRRIGEQHPGGAIDQHHTPPQALKPFWGGIMVEIAHPKLTMNTNGAVDVRQRGLEGNRLLVGNVIVLGRISDTEQCRTLVPDEQIDSQYRKPEFGRAKPLVEHGGSGEVLSRHNSFEGKDLAGWHLRAERPERVMESPIVLVAFAHDWIGSRGERIISLGATVHGGQANLRRPCSVGQGL